MSRQEGAGSGSPFLQWLRASWARFDKALSKRDYRPVWHTLSVLFIILVACLLFYKNFPQHGTMMYTDMTWPNTLSRLQFNASNTWMPYGSFPIVGGQLWFFWIYPTAALAKLLHISFSTYMFLMFLGTFSLAGISMYALSYSTINSLKYQNVTRYSAFCGAVVAAIIYMYNPWSLLYMRAYFGYPMYAFLPLLFLALVKTCKSPTPRNIILFSLFVTLVNTSHHLVWFWTLFLSYILFFLFAHRFEKGKIKDALKVLVGTVGLYLLLGASWVMPYLGSQLAGQPVRPAYSPGMVESAVKGLSAHNTILNNLRLVSFWSWSLETVSSSAFLQALVFALPVLAVVSLIVTRKYVKNNPVVNYWAMLSLTAILLATGSSFVLKRIYIYVTLDAPGASFFGWMLRASERWLFFVPLFFALMIGILVSKLLIRKPEGLALPSWLGELLSGSVTNAVTPTSNSGARYAEKPSQEERLVRIEHGIAAQRYLRGRILIIAILIVVIVSLYPVAAWAATRLFNPADVPKDYEQVNEFLSKKPEGRRVVWLPFYSPAGYTYSWAPEKVIGPYSIFSSYPSLNNLQEVMNNDSYFNWFQGLYLKGQYPPVRLADPGLLPGNDEMSRLLSPFAARYVILDRSVRGYDFGESFVAEGSLKEIFRTKNLTVYETDYDPGYISAAARTAGVNSFFDNLVTLQKLTNEELDNLAFFNGSSFLGGASSINQKYGVVDIDRFSTKLTINGSFEETESNQQPVGWFTPAQTNTNHAVQVVNDTSYKGRRSLEVTNKSANSLDICWTTTWEEPAQAGNVYSFETAVKYRNAEWSLAVIEGYQSATGQWVQLLACPNIGSGSSGWKKFRGSLVVPEGFTKIRPSLGAGWVKDGAKGPAVTWFDSIELSKVDNSFFSTIAQKGTPPQISFEEIDSSEYKVNVKNATRPFVLVHAEAYDGLWVAETSDGNLIESVPIQGTINGFPIDQTGDFELTVRFRLQSWLSAGFVISLTTLSICILAILFYWLASRRRTRLAPTGEGAGIPSQRGLKKPARGHPANLGREPAGRPRRRLGDIGRRLLALLDEPPKRTKWK